LGIITTPLICLGIITVLIFGDYYVAFWGLLLSSISGIIQATPRSVSLHFTKKITENFVVERVQLCPKKSYCSNYYRLLGRKNESRVCLTHII
jgi:hypothetical protein